MKAANCEIQVAQGSQKAQSASENLTRLNDITNELQLQIEPLKESGNSRKVLKNTRRAARLTYGQADRRPKSEINRYPAE